MEFQKLRNLFTFDIVFTKDICRKCICCFQKL